MADTNSDIYTDGTAGVDCDYEDLATWEADAQGWGSSGDTNTATCRCDSGGSATADGAFVVAGWETGVIPKLTPYSGHEASLSAWDATKYRIEGLYTVVRFEVPNFIFEKLQVRSTGDNGIYNSRAMHVQTSGTTGGLISKCRLRVESTGTGAVYGVYCSSAYSDTTTVENTIVEAGPSLSAPADGIIANIHDIVTYNCLVVGFDIGYGRRYSSTYTAVNCIAQGCTDGFSSVSGSSDYNLSDISSDAPGANSVTSTLTFADASNGDYHLASGDTDAIGAGIGPSSDANVPTTDIDGDTRSGTTCDIGADEYAAAGGGGGGTIYNPFASPMDGWTRSPLRIS